jgi:hypothetical protein
VVNNFGDSKDTISMFGCVNINKVFQLAKQQQKQFVR